MNTERLFIDRSPSPWAGAIFAALSCAVATAIALPFRMAINAENTVVLYLIAIVLTATRCGAGASALASLLCVLAYNFFFTRPFYSLNVYDYHDLITLGLLLLSSLVIGSQTSRLVAQTRFYRAKERETARLYAMANDLSATSGSDACLEVLRHHLAEAFDAFAVLWHPAGDGMTPIPALPECEPLREHEAARWASDHAEPAGSGTSTLPGATFHYLPIPGSNAIVAVQPRPAREAFAAPEFGMMRAFVSLAHAALERSTQASRAEAHQREAESEAMRATLLSAVSHDFRTPLATIRGAVEGLRLDVSLDAGARAEMLDSAHGEIMRLERVVTNLLDLTQLTTGRLQLTTDFYFADELIGNALKATVSLVQDRPVTINLAPDLPAVNVDGLLIEQAIVNLIENSCRHTPAGTAMTLSATTEGAWLLLDIADQGPGIPTAAQASLFQSFHATGTRRKGEGSGLGLAICHAILAAHGGSISIIPRPVGACFRLSLTIANAPELSGDV